MERSGSTDSTPIDNEEKKLIKEEEMQIDTEPATTSRPPPRVPSPMITVTDQDSAAAATSVAPATLTTTSRQLTPTRERKKSPAAGATPRQRKRSQPVRGELLPDPDKLLSYKHHDKKEEDLMEDPTFPGGHPKPPPEPRAPGQPAERKRSNVTFCPVVKTIEK